MPVCTNGDCGRRYIGPSCPFCKVRTEGNRRSMNDRGFGQLSSMFADVERAPVNFSGNVSVTNVTGDLVRGDKGPKLIDVGGDFAPAKDDSQPDGTVPWSSGQTCQSCGFDLTPIEDPRFCPVCASTLTLPELASYLQVSEPTLYDWAQRDILPAFKLGGGWRFRQEEIDAWLETRRSGPSLGGMSDQCCICSRGFGAYLLRAGQCECPGCTSPICETCWGVLGRRNCVAHPPAGLPDPNSAALTLNELQGLGVTSESADALASDLFLDGFVHRMEGRPYLLGSDGVPIVGVNNWRKIKLAGNGQDSAQLSGARHSRGRRVRQRRTGNWTAYRFRVPAGCLSQVPRDVRVEARCVTSETRGNRGQGMVPVSADDLQRLLAEARAFAEAEKVLYVLCVFAPQGWSDEAAALFEATDRTQGFLSPDLSVAIVGQSLSEVHRNSSDRVLNQLGFYFEPAFDDEVVRCRDLIRGIMADFDVYLVGDLAEQGRFSPAVVRAAIESLVITAEIKTNSEYGPEVIVSKNQKGRK